MVAEQWSAVSAEEDACVQWWRDRLALVPHQMTTARYIPRGGETFRDHLDRGFTTTNDDPPMTRFCRYLAALAWLWARHSGGTTLVLQTPPLQQAVDSERCGICANEPVLMVLEVDPALAGEALRAAIQSQVEETYAHANTRLTALLYRETGLAPSRLTPLLVFCPQLHSDPCIEPNLLIQIDLDQFGSIAYHANLVADDYDLLRLHLYWQSAYQAVFEAQTPLALLLDDAQPTWLSDPQAVVSSVSDGLTQDGLFTWFLDLEDIAQEQPGAPACRLNHKVLTYAALCDDVKRLASYLQCEMGLVPADPVLVYLNRSSEAVTAMLAVLNVGGVVIPLDPAQNESRVSDIIAEAQPRFALTCAGDAADLIGFRGQYLLLDVLLPVLPEVHTQIYPILPQEQAALVYYGAGESESIQGAVLNRGALYDYVTWARDSYRLPGDACSFAWFQSFSAAASLTPIFCTLLQGGLLTIFPEHVTETDILTKLHDDHLGVTAIKLNRCRLARLRELGPAYLPTRLVVVDSAELSCDDVLWLRTVAPAAVLWREYGCCESGLAFAATTLNEGLLGRDPLPLGRPITGKKVAIVNQQGLPCPPGVAGEIWVAGGQLGAAYLCRPELSQAAFCWDVNGTPVYRSRAWGYWLEDGQVVHLGFMGRQFQMGDFRVQPAEIERLLSELEGVEEALVVVRQISSRDPQMTAYVLGYNLDEETIFEQLAERLPAFLIPNFVVPMVAWPLHANGTIDYAGLPEPEVSRSAHYASEFEPQTYREALLAHLFANSLGLNEVGVTDNFFKLGGDEQAAMDLLRTARALDFYFSFNDFVQAPCVRDLARVPDRVGVEVIEQSVAGEVHLLPFYHRFFAAAPDDPDSNVETMVLEVPEGVDVKPLEMAVQRLLTMHDGLRARFVNSDEGWRAEIMPPAEITAFSLEDLNRFDELELETRFNAVHEQARSSLCLDWGLLFHVCLVRMGGEVSDRLILVAHQLIVDEVSWRVLLSDLGELYRCFSANRDPYPLAKTDSLRSWALVLQQEAQSHTVVNQSRFWLEDALAVTPLFKNYILPGSVDAGADNELVLSLDRHTSQSLLVSGRRVLGQRIYTLLLSGLACAVRDFSGEEAAMVLLSGQGRRVNLSGLDVSRTVGHLTSHFPFCLTMPFNADELEIADMTARHLQMVQMEGMGYGMLRHLSRDNHVRKLFGGLNQPEIAFNYAGAVDEQPVPGWLFMEHRRWSEERLRRPLMIEGFLREGVLQFRFEWIPSRLEEATVINLAMAFLKNLGRLSERIAEQTPAAARMSSMELPISDIHNTTSFLSAPSAEDDPVA